MVHIDLINHIPVVGISIPNAGFAYPQCLGRESAKRTRELVGQADVCLPVGAYSVFVQGVVFHIGQPVIAGDYLAFPLGRWDEKQIG